MAALLLCPHMAEYEGEKEEEERGTAFPGVSSYKRTNPVGSGPHPLQPQ